LADGGVARIECGAGGGGMVGALEQVRVHLERDVRVGVAELAGDVDDVETVGDQQRGEAMPERVQGQSFTGGG
jgi:hypothetical protein